jgi:chitin disaccharide deacetylase
MSDCDTRYLTFNADDFGASTGINRGIVECHTRGVVTSASLMVEGRAVHEAVAISRDCPALSVGLHWDV